MKPQQDNFCEAVSAIALATHNLLEQNYNYGVKNLSPYGPTDVGAPVEQ